MSAHYVYRCYDADGRLIYVGSTADLWTRLATHARLTWWAYQVARVTARVYPNKPIALAHERRAIATEGPRWNVMGRWQSRFGWTVEDYTDYHHAFLRGCNTDTPAGRHHLRRVEREVLDRFGVELGGAA